MWLFRCYLHGLTGQAVSPNKNAIVWTEDESGNNWGLNIRVKLFISFQCKCWRNLSWSYSSFGLSYEIFTSYFFMFLTKIGTVIPRAMFWWNDMKFKIYLACYEQFIFWHFTKIIVHEMLCKTQVLPYWHFFLIFEKLKISFAFICCAILIQKQKVDHFPLLPLDSALSIDYPIHT